MELDEIYNDKAPLKRAIIWTGALDEVPDWKVKDNIYVPISTILDKGEDPKPDPEPYPVEDSEITIYIDPECRVKYDTAGSGYITIHDSTHITTNTFLLHLVDTTPIHLAVKNSVPSRTTKLTSLNADVYAKYLNVDGGKEMKPFTIKAIYDNEGTPHYWRVVYKAGRYFIITGIRTSSDNNERTSSQYVIQKAEVKELGCPCIVYYLQLVDGYNVIS